MQFPDPTWFVGVGHMAGAMVEGWRSAGVDLNRAVAIRPSGTPVEGVRTVRSLAEAGLPPKLVVLGFKPQKLDEVAPVLAPWLTSKATVISILAGVESNSLKQRFPKAGAVVRAMPNLPVAVRRGIVALYAEGMDEERRSEITRLFLPLGMTHWAHEELELAGIGAVAGAGPAYVARFIGALAKAGEARGLHPTIAHAVALETVFGTAWMAAAGGETMDAVVRRVASPNGTTQAGLRVLDPELEQLIARTVEASARRASELAAEARSGGQVDSPAVLP